MRLPSPPAKIESGAMNTKPNQSHHRASGPRRAAPRPARPDQTAPYLMPTTLWDFPSRNYGGGRQGSTAYVGATPSYVVWNLIERYTKPGDLVVDPMAGSGTTLDVARDLGRKALAYDIAPARPDVFRADARKLPLEDGKASLVFVDPPYSTHVDYSDDPRCIGKLDAAGPEYFEAMGEAILEMRRVLKPGGVLGLYVSDSYVKGKGFFPIGFELFALMRGHFTPLDVIAVVRRNKTLDMGNYRKAALEGNFYLRGFNYLFIMEKPRAAAKAPGAGLKPPGSGGRQKRKRKQ